MGRVLRPLSGSVQLSRGKMLLVRGLLCGFKRLMMVRKFTLHSSPEKSTTECISSGGRHNTGYTQKNGTVSIVKTIETAPFFCVYPVQVE